MSEGFYDEPYGQTWERDFTLKIDKRREKVHSSKTRSASQRFKLFEDNYQTGDNYDDCLIDFRLYAKAYIMLKNTHIANGLTYKIEGCIEPSLWEDIVTATNLAAGAMANAEVTKAYSYLKVSVKSQVSATPATLLAFAGMKA